MGPSKRLVGCVILVVCALIGVELGRRRQRSQETDVYLANANYAAELSKWCGAELTADGPFGRISQSEFASKWLLHANQPLWGELLSTSTYPNINQPIPPLRKQSVRFDWEERGAVSTEVHNQGSLGTCAAFAVTGNIEGQRAIHGDGILEALSVEQIVECSAESDPANDEADCGVFGGWPKLVLDYVKKRGVATARDWPYCSGTLDKKLTPACYPCMPQGYSRQGCDDHDDDFYCNPESTLGQRKKDGWCSSGSSFHATVKIQDFKVLDDSADEEVLKGHLEHYGPLAVTISIGPLQLYRKGILDPPDFICPRKGRPGYGEENGKPYWRFKNSWGAEWGERGFFRLRRGINSCGVGRFQIATAIGVKANSRASNMQPEAIQL